MKLAVLCIGDELLKGSTVNTNLAHIGSTLMKAGIIPRFCLEVPDESSAILAALKQALEHADIVITTGGLGPTADDMTKETIARHFGYRLEEDSASMANIHRFWKQRHSQREIPSRVLNQALVPAGADILENRNGTAPGLILRVPDSKAKVIMLPGPPNELEPMFDEDVLPLLQEEMKEACYTVIYRIAGIGESEVEDRMLPIISRYHPLQVAYCASAGMVRLFLTSSDTNVLADASTDVKGIFGKALFGDKCESLAADVVRLLKRERATFATAESCTGGLVAKEITDVSGSSSVFLGGVVAYANEIKQNVLGVKAETLEEFGAVSEETAEEMVRGLAEKFNCDAAISLTGIAGPGGGSLEKPVGLVYAGIYWRGKVTIHELHLRRSRSQIRERAAASALYLLREMMLSDGVEKA